MGVDSGSFVLAVDADVKCITCGRVLEETLCAECLAPWAALRATLPDPGRPAPSAVAVKRLVGKLAVRCGYFSRGCKEEVRLQDLRGHMETCVQRPAVRRDGGGARRGRTRNSGDAGSHGAPERCQKGCGLVLPREDLAERRGNHCCVAALRARNGALRAMSARLERESQTQRLSRDRRERHLLAQVCASQKEALRAALVYQGRLRDYISRIQSVTQQVVDCLKKVGMTVRYVENMNVALHKETEMLGPRITDAASCQVGGLILPGFWVRQVCVNGKDLSKASHEETAEAFRSSKEPIVVQVLRRTPVSRGSGNSQDVHVVDVCTQTDITFEHIMALAKLRPTTPPVPDICPFLLSDRCHELCDGSEYLSSMAAHGERTDEFEYEEVELCRLSSQEKLGLTLCYRTDEEDDVAIYVSEVGPNSIAARDGRIREGDRIVQINGRDVQNREEAVAALSNEDCRSLVLLVARPEIQLDEGWLDDEHSAFLEELKMEMLEEQQREEAQDTSKKAEEDDITTDTVACSSNHQYKDSTLDHTNRRTHSDGHSQPGVLARVHKTLSRYIRDKRESNQSQSDTGPQFTHSLVAGGRLNSLCPGVPEAEEEEEDEDECDHFQQLLELKCQIRNSGEYDVYYSRHSTIECSLAEQDGVGRELRLLNEELRNIELECQNIMQAHQLRKARDQYADRATRNHSNRADSPRGKLVDISERLEKSDKDSSSAYNTAESCRSTPLVMDRSPDHNLSATLGAHHSHPVASQAIASSPEQSNPSESDQPIPADDEGCGQDEPLVPQSPYLSPYHSSQYRHANIPAHARHYQSYMHLVQQRSAVEFAQSQLSLVGVEPKMEWKVKVRADGTRYITKRPARDKILRERALKIREERAGMTTDDDAASELKMGRYWSKEERKQQLARAREQRRRREFMQRCRLESPREAPQSSGESRREVSIIELSHRKMMKKRNKKILDNWLTIQELMTHGAKAPDGAKVHNAFLSVTTV
uniref:PDZ domain containing ring finger 4 n=1 Tax=Scleropages formosus TaxID=113540 RepID=A0A8D0CHT7_SCLFO